MTYEKETWEPNDYFTETTANKWEQGLSDACDNINEIIEGGGGGGSSVIYSTDERVIGTWIDDRPLYQKTFHINDNIQSGRSTTYPHEIENIDAICKISFTTKNAFGLFEKIPRSHGSTEFVRHVITKTAIEFINYMGYNYADLYVILEYVKTTDL